MGLSFEDLRIGETFVFSDEPVLKIFRKTNKKEYVKADMNTPIPTTPNSIVDTHIQVVSASHIFHK